MSDRAYDLALAAQGLGAALALLGAIVAAYRAPAREGRLAACGAALCALVALVAGVVRAPTLEQGYRRVVYLASASAGRWLDRAQQLGFAGLCFALAAGLYALAHRDGEAGDLERASAARALVLRVLGATAALWLLAAFAQLAFVTARTPDATL